jgi:alkaline phosphatase D
MQKHQPAFFLHLGDWLYTNNFNERQYYYAESLEHQKELYEKRYEMPNLKKFLQTTPMDFVFDDEDGVFDDFSKHSYTELKMNGNVTEMKEVPYPDSLRKMAIEGLHTFFPSYQEVENQAYHSFVYGNTEVFFLDTRSTRSPNTEVFTKTKNGKYTYKVPNGHNILDSAQMNWLLNKLKNSTAQWKFIVSGVTFNKSYKKIIDIAMLKPIQNRKLPNGMTGAYISASLASMWFAFPETQARLINFCRDNAIKNVIVLSGDAHTAAIDDGANAGFPELMAGGLAQKNSKIASIINNNLQLNPNYAIGFRKG